MAHNVIAFPLTATSKHRLESAGNKLAHVQAVDLLELARFASGDPPGCRFLRYSWMSGKLYALYKHVDWDAVAAFGYDAQTRKLAYVAALNY